MRVVQSAETIVKSTDTITKSAIITAYTCDYESTGKHPGSKDFCRTASGKVLTEMDVYRVVAADINYYPFGTRIYIEDLGWVEVVDTGGDIKGLNRLDLFVSVHTSETAYKWGRRDKKIWIGD